MRVYFTKPDIPKLRKDGHFLVDMHAHSEHSHDCRTPLQLIIAKARGAGFCVALTDHNSVAGTAAALKAHAHDTIMPAVEITTKEGKDIIAYFYSHKELLEFFETRMERYIKRKSSIRSGATGISMAELLDELKRVNCVIALPHPFAMHPRRSYTYFREPANKPLLRHIDTFEVINQAMLHRQNLAAAGWAMQYNKAITGGSDGHTIHAVGSAFTVSTSESWEDFLEDVKAKRVAVIGEERQFRRQMLDSAKSATRILATKANVLRRRK